MRNGSIGVGRALGSWADRAGRLWRRLREWGEEETGTFAARMIDEEELQDMRMQIERMRRKIDKFGVGERL
ncbi:hypothetical protein [Paenibacillus flagellatus]|uniref:Uncharacterized protein n=1 Tax=Paenibacillus flagellatus TaxID=2211139 RepID=A0A2V5KUE2_9BACL|nr:hypothetical protein [Paenibacillus flagellatus]PYI52956.1 hypothetical protein DLM86_18325 [Paenibacillus flagellatus]